MRKLLPWLLAVIAGPPPSTAQLLKPLAGCVIDRTNTLRPVFGIAANFWLGEPLAAGAVSAACSGTHALVKTESSLAWLDLETAAEQSWDAPPGPAVSAIFHDSAIVYFPATSEWFQARPNSLVPLDPAPPRCFDELLALAMPDSGRLVLAVRRQEEVWKLSVSLADGRIESESELPEAARPVLLLPDGSAAIAVEGGLAIESGIEERTVIPLPAPAAALTQMGGPWIAVTLADGRGRMAVRAAGGRIDAHRLPEVAP